MSGIILYYHRHDELVEDKHPFSGRVDYQQDGEIIRTVVINRQYFTEMMTEVSRVLRDFPDASLVFHRTERKNLRPVQVGEQLRTMLRDDPVAAIRFMDGHTDGQMGMKPESNLRTAYDTLAEAFGEKLYLRMRHGKIEDPLTGKWLTLAYGEKIGWRIRGENNDSSSWLPIELCEVDVELVDGVQMMEKLSTALARCRWASVKAEDLLNTQEPRFYIPRHWNRAEGGWISCIKLASRLQRFIDEKNEAQSCQDSDK